MPTYQTPDGVTVQGYAHGAPWSGFATPRATFTEWRACVEAAPPEAREALLASLDADPYADVPLQGHRATSTGLPWVRVA